VKIMMSASTGAASPAWSNTNLSGITAPVGPNIFPFAQPRPGRGKSFKVCPWCLLHSRVDSTLAPIADRSEKSLPDVLRRSANRIVFLRRNRQKENFHQLCILRQPSPSLVNRPLLGRVSLSTRTRCFKMELPHVQARWGAHPNLQENANLLIDGNERWGKANGNFGASRVHA
jgi:hypothetical protein